MKLLCMTLEYLSIVSILKFADGIICTDVIEHITPEDILKFIDELYLLSNKFLFLLIATKPASKYFDDGRNIHLTLKNHKEWDLIFEDFKKNILFTQ